MRALFAVAAIALFCACPPNTPPQPPPSPPGPVYAPPDGGPPAPIELVDAAPSAREPGAACVAATDCDSGICEGLGCDAAAPGHCAAQQRICTMDLVATCGCDGQTFQASSTCPGRRFAHRGACETAAKPPAAKKKSGDACVAADDCESGICEGQGCGDDAPGRCAPTERKCTRDRRPYCGCDGKTFSTSGSCPGQRYAHSGKC